MVNLRSSKTSVATVPDSVTIPEGATQTNFNISTVPQKTNAFLVISASGGVTQSNTLGVVPMLGGISLIASSVVGGGPISAAVVLNANAPAAGTTVTLSSNKPSVLPVPASVTVPEGASQLVFTLTTNPTSANATVTIQASLGSTITSTSVTVTQVLASLSVSPNSTVGGNNAHGTVTLTGPAYAGGVSVSLSSSNSSAAAVPSNVTVPAGATKATFNVSTMPVASATPGTITANSGGSIKSATLTVTAPVLSSLSLSPSTVVGGAGSTGTVKLTGAAPSGGISVSLSSSNPSVATVPSSVTVASGESSATFNIDTASVSNSTSVSIAASLGSAVKMSPLKVTSAH